MSPLSRRIPAPLMGNTHMPSPALGDAKPQMLLPVLQTW